MAKSSKETLTLHTKNAFKKSSTSGKAAMVKLSSMNKKRKASYKPYRGQGR